MDDLNLHSNALGRNLEELAIINRFLGGYDTLNFALTRLEREGFFAENRVYTVADIGSGGGDNLLYMAKWFKRKGIKAHLIGLDANNYMIEFAKKHCADFSNITFEQQNVFDTNAMTARYDLTTCSLFCHHFTDEELVEIFKNIQTFTTGYFIINDLHRHWLAYYSIKYLTQWFSRSYLVVNDAPLSVRRAFTRSELQKLTQQVFGQVDIHWVFAFRWSVIAKSWS